MQTQGSLREADLASLLQTMQSERKTGRLILDAGGQSCTLFFLFGHLFHATGPDGDGEAVVIRALSWTDGTYQYDRRSKLVATETVRSSPAELIAAAHEAQRAAAAAARFASATSSLHTMEGQAAGVGDGGSTPDSSASWMALENEARDLGRSRQRLAAQREPPLFPSSPSRTARRSRRQSSDGRRSGL